MKVYINNFEYLNFSKQSGKMEGIPSLSTNKYTNENCIKLMNSKKENIICKHCFVDKVTKRFGDLTPALEHNSQILTKRALTNKEIKRLSEVLGNALIFRFESFGDLNNEIQLINYVNIARAYPKTKFGLFTKHFAIVLNYFKNGLRFPKNITLVLSAPFINEGLNNSFVDIFKKYHSRIITFSVTNDKKNPNINCGKKKCIDCRNCYDAKKPKNVIELLK